MKYEIIKGSEKDFENYNDDILTVYRINSGLMCHKTTKPAVQVILSTIGSHVSIIAERRPITEPVWDGFSSVRVGEACEVRPYSDATEWQAGIVNYLSDHTVVIGLSSMTNGKAELVAHPATLKFRPIRSPEDVARDEAVAAMFYKVPQDKVAGKDLREAIYDAIAAGKIPGITLSGK